MHVYQLFGCVVQEGVSVPGDGGAGYQFLIIHIRRSKFTFNFKLRDWQISDAESLAAKYAKINDTLVCF